MRIKKLLVMIGLATSATLCDLPAYAQAMDNFGQIIQIRTNLNSIVSKASWLVIIRDMDHGQNIPYIFDFTQKTNFWTALTYSKNYLVTVSELTFYPSERKIKNFCGLESMGSVQHGVSMEVILTGKLSSNPDTFTCNALKYSDANFNMNALE